MLTIFHVDTGRLVPVDIQHAMESVSDLQAALANEIRIPIEKQVLLSSDGLTLSADSKVASYNTGTETSPLFLYDKSSIELAESIVQSARFESARFESANDLVSRLKAARNMRPCPETLRERIQLAQLCHREGAKLARSCADLLRDQRWQKMGWDAAFANLEKTGTHFKQRMQIFQAKYKKFLEMMPSFYEELEKFDSSLDLLRRIRLPSSLIGSTDKEMKIETLLDWISMHDSNCSIENLGEKCRKALNHVTEVTLQETMKQAELIAERLDNCGMKEVVGLSKRLGHLQVQLERIVSMEREQGNIAEGWQKNGERARALKDLSILPDLCAMHEAELPRLAERHQQLRQSNTRFSNAKQELTMNLHKRLRWLVANQNRICECDGQVMLQLENLKQCRQRIEVVMQINRTPLLYLKAVGEILRRKQFNEQFLNWASEVSGVAVTAREDEVNSREEFSNNLGKHFVQSLFSILSSLPPRFATEMPCLNEASISDINQSYFQELNKLIPTESSYLSVSSNPALYYSESSVEKLTRLEEESYKKEAFESRLEKIQLDAKERIQAAEQELADQNATLTMTSENLSHLERLKVESEEKCAVVTSQLQAEANNMKLIIENLENSLAKREREVVCMKQDIGASECKKALAEKEKRIILLEGKLSDALLDKETEIEQIEEEWKKRFEAREIELKAEFERKEKEKVEIASLEDKEDVTKKLMESERDLKVMKRSVDKAEKLMRDKKLFEERLLKREQEMEVKFQEMEKCVDDLSKLLKLNGVAYSFPKWAVVKARPKMALTDFNVGDLALFVLSEDWDAYVAYTVGNIMYFLHPDSLRVLGLAEEKKAHVLAYVIEKEYCQCKKKNNRFKLPVGTRFYRVKASLFKLDKETQMSKSESAACQ